MMVPLALFLSSALSNLTAAEEGPASNPSDLIIRMPPFEVLASTEQNPIVELGDLDVAPAATWIGIPQYPAHLKRYLLGASVDLVYVVTKTGVVQDAHAAAVTLIDYSFVAPEELKTSERRRQEITRDFAEAAVAFAKQMRYRPGMKYDAVAKKLMPVGVRMKFTVKLIARPNAK
jgi:PAS domain-containing protein